MDDKFEQISISELINILIKRKNIIFISIIGFLLIGLLSSFVLTKQMYSSEISLEINDVNTTTPKPPSAQSGAANNVIESITSANEMDFEFYLSQILSETVLEKTIKDLNLEDTYTTTSLRKVLSISSDPETKKINIKTILPKPEEGTVILNKLEENFANHITKLSTEKAIETLEVLEKQMDIEKDKYAESLNEYKEAMKENISSRELELELEGKYKQLTDYKLSINDLEIKIDSVKAAIKKSNSTNDGMFLRPEKGDGYVYMGSNRDVLEIELAENQSKLNATKTKIKDLKEEIQTLEIDYQDIAFAENVTKQKLELNKQSYEAFSQKYEELNMQSSLDLGGISINKLSQPSPTGKPIGRSKAIKIIVFLTLGLVTGVLLAFLVEYLQILKTKRKNIK